MEMLSCQKQGMVPNEFPSQKNPLGKSFMNCTLPLPAVKILFTWVVQIFTALTFQTDLSDQTLSQNKSTFCLLFDNDLHHWCVGSHTRIENTMHVNDLLSAQPRIISSALFNLRTVT